MDLRSLMPFSRAKTSLTKPANGSFDVLQREIDRVFDDFNRSFGTMAANRHVPTMDVSESGNEIEITVELPGMEEKDVNVSLSGDVLTIRGEKKTERSEQKDGDDKDRAYHVTERSYGSFYRSIELPGGIDPQSIKARMTNGVLRVTLPKPPESEAKKIAIENG